MTSEPSAGIQRRASDGAWRDGPHTPWMINLPFGAFQMGETCDDKFAGDTERPAHRGEITSLVAMGAAPVTVKEYRAFDFNHAALEAEYLPVAEVGWDDARAYCAWLTGRTGRVYRLPCEAEWEYACRAGSSASFALGSEITLEDANFLYSEHGQRIGIGARTPVGAYTANAFGFWDLHGNVCEWVEDAWHPNYIGAPGDASAWIKDGIVVRRVIRGGAWDYMPRLLRSAWRDWLPANQRRDNVGFRVATSEPVP